MDDPRGVGRAHRGQDIERDRPHFVERERPGPHPVAQRRPRQAFHDDERLAVVGDAGVVDRDDVRVMQAGGDPGLVLEPRLEVVGGHAAGPHDLDGDVALEAVIEPRMDVGHPALTDQVAQLIPIREQHQRDLPRSGPQPLTVGPARSIVMRTMTRCSRVMAAR